MENKYYTPLESEFIQGFEFEYYDNSSYRMVMLDFSSENRNPEPIGEPTVKGWTKCIVDWKRSSDETYTEKYKDWDNKECTLEMNGSTANWFSQFYHRDINKLIEDGKIRAIKYS